MHDHHHEQMKENWDRNECLSFKELVGAGKPVKNLVAFLYTKELILKFHQSQKTHFWS